MEEEEEEEGCSLSNRQVSEVVTEECSLKILDTICNLSKLGTVTAAIRNSRDSKAINSKVGSASSSTIEIGMGRV